MTNTEKSKTYSLVAAICFSLLAVISISIWLINHSQSYYYYPLSFTWVFKWIALIALAATLFTKNKLAVTIASGVFLLHSLCCLISYFCLINILYLLAATAVLVLLILALMNVNGVKGIWFIGGALFFVAAIVELILNEYFLYLNDIRGWLAILSLLIYVVGFLFVGLWSKECIQAVENSPVNGYASVNYRATYAAPVGYGAGQANGYAAANPQATNVAPTGYGAGQVNGYAASNPQTTYAAPAGYGSAGDIEKLNMCKTLLDAGAITQEEFDAKKKEILGL